jgi:NADPH:quinone reductase
MGITAFHTAVGVLAVPRQGPAAEAAVWDRLAELAARGAITTPVGTVYGFTDVPRMIAGQAAPPPGKSVVRVTPQ